MGLISSNHTSWCSRGFSLEQPRPGPGSYRLTVTSYHSGYHSQTSSGAAESGGHAFGNERRLGQIRERRLLLIRPREHAQQRLEGFEIAVHARGDRLLDAVIARDECGVRQAHGTRAGLGRYTLEPKPSSPGLGKA